MKLHLNLKRVLQSTQRTWTLCGRQGWLRLLPEDYLLYGVSAPPPTPRLNMYVGRG